jgi:DNA-binding NarL/FixJ family response regulator
VEALAEPQGYEVQRATTESIFWDHYASRRPGLILIDLEGDERTWSNVLEILNQKELDGAKVVAFGPHENVATLERARNLGCDLVLNKGEFNRDLPKIIGSIGVNSG